MAIPENIARETFGQDYQGNSVETDDPIKAQIVAIDPETARTELPGKLQPVLGVLAKQTNAELEAYLGFIKEHFKLPESMIKGFQRDLRQLRKDLGNIGSSPPPSQPELIEKLRGKSNTADLNTAQDFDGDEMYFTIKIEGQPYLLSSGRQLIAFEQAADRGLHLKHDSVDTVRFSPDGIIGFIEGSRSVCLVDLFERIYRYIRQFIFFTDKRWSHYLTLWAIGTYVFTIFGYYPYVWLNAEKQSGKSLLMKVLSKITFNGEVLISPTTAVVFRDVSHNSISMFIDEVEQLRKQDKETHSAMISILNNGFECTGVVKRVEKGKTGSFEMKVFTTFSPKMFAGINDIDDVLQDRTVRINLMRKKDSEHVERYKETNDLLKLQRDIMDDLYIFALQNAARIAALYQDEDSAIHGVGHLANRELDIWEPIFVLANFVDQAYGSDENRVTAIMTDLSTDALAEKQEDSEKSNDTYKALSVMKEMIVETDPFLRDDDKLVFKADDTLKYFQGTDEYSWLEKQNALTRRLKRINVKTTRTAFMGDRVAAYVLIPSDFEDRCERFNII